MVSADSCRVPRAPQYSGIRFESSSFSPTRLSRPMASLSRELRLTTGLVTLLLPALQPPLDRNPPGLGCCDFARHYSRNRGFFLFLLVLRWFTSQGSLVPDYGFIGPYRGFTAVGFPIRTSPSQSLLAAHRGLSQLATSFVAIFCQGIHHAPLVT